MKVVITEFTKDVQFNAEVNGDCTTLTVGIHPVLSVNKDDGTADISAEGIQPVIRFNGQVLDHTEIAQALHDMADMITTHLEGVTVEGLREKAKASEVTE